MRRSSAGAPGRRPHIEKPVRRAAEKRLLELLVDRSYRSADAPVFRLASGKMSTYYVDCRATTTFAEAMPLIARAFLRLMPAEAQAVGGLTMGADPIAYAIACFTGAKARKLNAFSVRKEPKGHGLAKWIEGSVLPGSKVVIVEDVVTTGGSTIQAIRRCREEGLEVIGVVALVDREEHSGIGAIRDEVGSGATVQALFTRSDLEAYARAKRAVRRTR